ncbi:MAG: ribonuclease HII [Rhizobiaceae bacterium]
MSPSSDTDSPFFPRQKAKQAMPDYSREQILAEKGAQWTAGIDEAGRGPLAGPVVAAAVILDLGNIPDGLNDSKKLGGERRKILFDEILQSSQVAWCAAGPTEIDRINILQATLLAMTRAAYFLPVTPDAILIDGRDVPAGLRRTGNAVIGGDAISQSIAAASIVAKVVRDRIMTRAELVFPGYGFARNMGYGTKAHRDAINNMGPCAIHRMSFSPMSSMTDLLAGI